MTKAEQVSLCYYCRCGSVLEESVPGRLGAAPHARSTVPPGAFLRSEIVARGRVPRAPAVRIRSLVLRLSRRRHALLLLPPVAEPHAHHLLLQLQRVRQRRDLRRRRFGTLEKVRLQNPLHAHLDGRPLLPLPPLSRDLVDAAGAARGRVRLLQPLVQQRLEFAHVFKAQLQSLEPADGGLGEHVPVERAQGQAHVRLREAQLDPPLLELLGKVLQLVRRRRLLVGVVVAVVPAEVAVVRAERVPEARVHALALRVGWRREAPVVQHAVDGEARLRVEVDLLPAGDGGVVGHRGSPGSRVVAVVVVMRGVMRYVRGPVMDDAELQVLSARFDVLLLHGGRPGAALRQAARPLVPEGVSVALDAVQVVALEEFLVPSVGASRLHGLAVRVDHGAGAEQGVGAGGSGGHAGC